MSQRILTYGDALREAFDVCLQDDPNVYLIGLGVPDPKGIFGTTLGLAEKYGDQRVMDMPVSESAVTGVAIGSALLGMRPVMSHQRVDFALMATDQIINNAAKWQYMFGGATKMPLTIRMIIGRGWGQGPQHAQNLQALYMHIPGLKVVMPSSPADAKGLMIASIKDNNPVIFMEHRWLHNVKGHVDEGIYCTPIGKGKIVHAGNDITIVATSYMTLQALKAAEQLRKAGIHAEVIDLRTIKPIDEEIILESVKKTGRLVVVDSGYLTGGVASEISAIVSEKAFEYLKSAIKRIATPDCPSPTSRALIKYYYPNVNTIIGEVLTSLNIKPDAKMESLLFVAEPTHYDVPDQSFTGPY